MSGKEMETMAQVIPEVVRRMLHDVHCCTPAKIESYDKNNKRAEITPLVKYITFKGQEIELKTISDVPVVFMGGLSCVLDIEYQPGDDVLVGFTDYGIGEWKASDGSTISSPDDLSDHQLTNAIVLGGLLPDGIDLSGAPKISIDKDGNIIITNNSGTITIDSSGKITFDNGSATIEIDGSNVVLNGGSLDVARVTDPVTTTLSIIDVNAIAAAMLASGAFLPSGNPPAYVGAPIPLTGGQIVSGNPVIKG